jgi:hypothetical protein
MVMSSETSPYAPPAARVADVAPNKHGLKYRSLWAMVLLIFGSLGIYYLVWFFRRRNGLNQLDSPIKLPMWPLVLTAAYYGGQVVLGVGQGIGLVPEVIDPNVAIALTLLELFIGVTMIVQCFRIKDIIQDHATSARDSDRWFVEEVHLSGVMTFFFSIFYLQWAINKYVVGGRDGRLLTRTSTLSHAELAPTASGS